MSEHFTSSRIGSVTVRHSRMRLEAQQKNCISGDDEYNTQSNVQSTISLRPDSGQRQHEQNWSLVDLLSRSATGQRLSRQRTTKSASVVSHIHHRYHSKPETARCNNVYFQSAAKNGGARLWRQPDLRMSRDYSLNETNEETDVEDNCEGSEYCCPISSGSSISWADDAVEAEQSENLAKLWQEVELVSGGGQRPTTMSDEVYSECLLWRQAFPAEASSHTSRFESMEEFLSGLEQDDEDITPTNVSNTADLLLSMSLEHTTAGSRHHPQQSLNKSTDLVTSWLSGCKLSGSDTTREHKTGTGISWSELETMGFQGVLPESPRETNRSIQSTGRAGSSRFKQVPQTPFPMTPRDPDFRLKWSASSLPRKSGSRDSDTTVIENSNSTERKKSLESNDGGQNYEMGSIGDGSTDTKDGSHHLSFKMSIPSDDKFRGRQNPPKPFLLWVFDRISPN